MSAVAQRRWRRPVAAAGQHGFLLAVAFVSVFPLYVMLIASFQRATSFDGVALLPTLDPTFENYSRVWNELGFDRMFLNSTILSLTSAVATTLLAAGAAYGFVRFRFAGRALLLTGVICLMAIPPVVVIVPLFLLMNDLGIVNQPSSAIVAEIGLLLPFATFLMFTYMKELPVELFEAAEVDGASRWRQFAEIAFPLSRPALATTMVICALYAWNELLVPNVLWQTEQLTTLMVGLAVIGPSRSGAQDVPLLMAGVVISILPLALAFLIGRRALVRGLVEGGDR